MLLALILYLFSMEDMRPGTEGGTRCRGVYISSVSYSKISVEKKSQKLITYHSFHASSSRPYYEADKYRGKFREFSVGLPLPNSFLYGGIFGGECVRPVGKRGRFWLQIPV